MQSLGSHECYKLYRVNKWLDIKIYIYKYINIYKYTREKHNVIYLKSQFSSVKKAVESQKTRFKNVLNQEKEKLKKKKKTKIVEKHKKKSTL
jgi:arsenate reductase-like glutaredoxin family protein